MLMSKSYDKWYDPLCCGIIHCVDVWRDKTRTHETSLAQVQSINLNIRDGKKTDENLKSNRDSELSSK